MAHTDRAASSASLCDQAEWEGDVVEGEGQRDQGIGNRDSVPKSLPVCNLSKRPTQCVLSVIWLSAAGQCGLLSPNVMCSPNALASDRETDPSTTSAGH